MPVEDISAVAVLDRIKISPKVRVTMDVMESSEEATSRTVFQAVEFNDSRKGGAMLSVTNDFQQQAADVFCKQLGKSVCHAYA